MADNPEITELEAKLNKVRAEIERLSFEIRTPSRGFSQDEDLGALNV
jgi:hypothetical protein